MFRGYGIAFERKGTCNFGNDFARNVVIFGFGNSSSSHTDNRKNYFLELGEGTTSGINRSFSSPEKSLVFTLVKQRQNFAWVCIKMMKTIICLLMEKKSIYV